MNKIQSYLDSKGLFAQSSVDSRNIKLFRKSELAHEIKGDDLYKAIDEESTLEVIKRVVEGLPIKAVPEDPAEANICLSCE